LPLIGGLFLIVYGAIGLLYYEERQAQAALLERIGVMDRLLQIAALQEPLAEVQARAKEVTSVIPVSILPDQDVFPAMRDLADEWGVEVLSQKSSRLRRIKFGENSYEAHPFDITVQGTYVEVMNFDRVLEFQEVIPTLVVRKVSIDAAADTGTAAITYEVV
jgi:hypothetical protein